MNSVLILTAGFGEGHNAAARNLKEALIAASPDTGVVMSDIFQEAYGGFNRFMQKAYIGAINHTPVIWQAVFELMHRTRLVEQHMFCYDRAARLLEKKIAELRPAVVVSTYPGCNHLLDYLQRRRLKRPYQMVTIVTDSLSINSVWLRAHSDFFIVANNRTADVVRKLGVSDDKVLTMGFPVPRIFDSLIADRPLPPADGLWRVLYVINSGKQLAPGIVRELLALPNIQLSVTVGRDEDLRRRVADVARELNRDVQIHGWTSEMPRFMAESHIVISKAGGATVQETLAAKTPMIITQIVPGQEEGNARLLLDSGAAALATTAEDIAATVADAFRDGGARWRGWHQAVLELSRPQASDEIARFVLELSQVPK